MDGFGDQSAAHLGVIHRNDLSAEVVSVSGLRLILPPALGGLGVLPFTCTCHKT